MDIVLGRIKKSNFFFDSSAILFSKPIKIVHLLTGAAALLLSLIPSLRGEAVPFLQQPDAIYLALFGLLNLSLAPMQAKPPALVALGLSNTDVTDKRSRRQAWLSA